MVDMHMIIKKLEEIIISQYQSAEFRLKEASPESKCKPIRLKKTGKMLVLKFDGTLDLLPFFNSSIADVKKMCDYIVIYPVKGKNKLFVFLCELKSGNIGDAGEQVRAGRHFAEYLISTALRLTGYHAYDIQYRALIFSTKIPAKGGTNPKSLPYEEYQYPVLNLKYKHLPCNQDCDINAYCF